LLPPESARIEVVAQEIGVTADTLERWRADALGAGKKSGGWTAVARFEAVLATTAMSEEQRSSWCREKGVFPSELAQWRETATQALAGPAEVRATPQQTSQDRRRIRELERDLRRKEKALAEAAALLVLAKKVEAIYQRGADE
jgi:hypothetical protein